MSTFQDLLSRHACSSLLKQNRFSDFLGEHNWNVDLEKGTADFGKGRVYPLQVIGTESSSNFTWLWGWANEASEIPKPLLAHALQLKELGYEQDIVDLISPEIALSQADGYSIALVATGVCGASAFYRGPYEGGALFFTLTKVPPPKRAPSAMELVNTMSMVMTQFQVNHRLMAQSFLEQQGHTVAEEGRQLVSSAPNGAGVTVTFDSLGRISNMEAKAGVEQAAPEKKSWWKFGK